MIDPAVHERLLLAARAAAENAYCPYSRFRVGAAVLADGQVFSGCNIENASYGLTICAERVAVFKAISARCRRLEAVLLVCPDAASDGALATQMPCGACRQVIAEFGAPDLPVIVQGVKLFRLSELLPNPFELDQASRPAKSELA